MIGTGTKVLIGIVAAVLWTAATAYVGYRWESANNAQTLSDWKQQVDDAKVTAAKVQTKNAQDQAALQTKYNDVEQNYEVLLQQQGPSIATATSTAIAAGSLILRDAGTQICPRSNAGDSATVAARAADAAATQALADRLSSSVAAVRAGDAADQRERELDAQIVGLQAIVIADRQVGTAVAGTTTDGKH